MATPSSPSLSPSSQSRPSSISEWDRAVPEEPESTSSAQSDQQEMPTLCGAAFTLGKNSEKCSVWRPATIGGVILLDGRPYALTAAHVFLPPRAGNSAGCCVKCDADDYNRMFPPPPGTSWWHVIRALQDIPEARPDCPNGRNCAAIERDAEFVLSFKDKGLRSFSTSVILPDLQGEEGQNGQVASVIGKAAWMNLDYGWALFDLGDIPISECLNRTRDKNKDLLITSVRPYYGENLLEDPEDQILSIATPRGGLDTRIHATLIPEWLAGSSDGHSKLTWRINYAHQSGDIGSWMVESQSGQLWGMVVSLGANGKGEVLPATAIFDDIKQAMGVERVTLPG